MKIQDGTFRRPLLLIAGAALFLAYAGSIVLCVAWVPTSIGPSVAIAAAVEATSGIAQRHGEPGNAELAVLLDWHLNASNGGSFVLNALSCSPRSAIAALPPVRSGKSL